MSKNEISSASNPQTLPRLSKPQINLQKQVIDRFLQIPASRNGLVGKTFYLSRDLTVSEVAHALNKPLSEIVNWYFQQGLMMKPTAVLTADQIGELCLAFDYDVEIDKPMQLGDVIKSYQAALVAEPNQPRNPIVTIMGHVDHGKSTLLEQYRKIAITSKEHGGITQHIGAYVVNPQKDRTVTFIDTPGHAAFTAMRARGSAYTDIVILVVAANEGVKPQTQEAINHARNAEVPIIVFLNKTDLASADVDNTLVALSQEGINPEKWGGDVPVVEGSALKGKGIQDLLETILLVSDLQELKCHPQAFASGTVLESKIDKQKGVIATLLVRDGTLALKDFVLTKHDAGRVRALTNDQMQQVQQASPSTPVLMQGFNKSPAPGSPFLAVSSEKLVARIQAKLNLMRDTHTKVNKTPFDLNTLRQKMDINTKLKLNLIVKTDTNGTLQVIKGIVADLKIDQVEINLIHSGVGEVNETDVDLAEVAHAYILGFNVKVNANANKKAEKSKIKIHFHQVVYSLANEIEKLAKSMLAPELTKKIDGHLEIKQIFHHSQIGNIAGCIVRDGLIKRNSKVAIIRNDEVLFSGEVGSLRYGTENVPQAVSGRECGVAIKNYNDFIVGDTIEAFHWETDVAKL